MFNSLEIIKPKFAKKENVFDIFKIHNLRFNLFGFSYDRGKTQGN